MLGGFQDCESTTLALISQMGVYPKNADLSYRRTGISRFRTTARAVLAIQRMNFLVKKSRRVSIGGSRESTSRSRVVNGDLSNHTVLQASASDYFTRSSRDISHRVPSLNLHQGGGVSTYPERYSPRSDRRTYEMRNASVNGNLDSRHYRPAKEAAAEALDKFSRRQGDDDPLSHRRYPKVSSRPHETYAPTTWSDSRSSSATRTREAMTSNQAQVMNSPPVRDIVNWRHDFGDRFVSSPRHSSPSRRESSGSPGRVYDDAIERPLSPSGASSIGSVHNGSDMADHSLNLYIHRLESLQNRLGAINRGKHCFLIPRVSFSIR